MKGSAPGEPAALAVANSPSGSAGLAVAAGGVAGRSSGVAVAAGATGAEPAAAGGRGLAGLRPYSGALGSQSLFFLDSAASCSAVRPWFLLRKGTGTLVTYTATASA